jgi:hypothetical protein
MKIMLPSWITAVRSAWKNAEDLDDVALDQV